MRGTRPLIRLLPHRSVSGLFLTRSGEYVADVKPDDGTRVVRRFGTDRTRALGLFSELLDKLAEQHAERTNPKAVDFLCATFLDSQRHLKAFDFAQERIRAIVRFLDDRYPGVRLSDVRRHHADALGDSYAHLSPRTRKANLDKSSKRSISLSTSTCSPQTRWRGQRALGSTTGACASAGWTTSSRWSALRTAT
ncbi:hypothetical protein FJZ36_17750 [Candidatus Poribacteria bacterium]|nr:hypothetical protein [Candidatus Poribacteria bacterium]